MVLLFVVLVGAAVALTYYFFEQAVHKTIDFIWHDLFDTNEQRLMVVPLALALGLAYFGAQHLLDPKSEKHESHGLGDVPKPTIKNFLMVLGVGFLSLVAGASLGPEAILVPASMILGTYIGSKAFKSDDSTVKILGAAALIALFAAFFHSFAVGLLSILLLKKKAKIKLTPPILLVAILAAGSSALVVKALSAPVFFDLPNYSWHLDFSNIVVIAILGTAGWFTTYLIGYTHDNSEKIKKKLAEKQWWYKGLAASIGLSVLYLLGGNLVEFTGNESIRPLLQQASSLGFIGLAWIFIVKICCIGWSKAMGYRGGMIFPTIFVATTLVAICQIFITDANYIYGLLAVMAGVIAADSRVKILL